MKFEDIPGTVKAAIAVGALAIGGFTYHDQFITEAEASQSARIEWISDLEAEIRTLKRLQRVEQDPDEREALQEEIEDLQEQLDCLKTADDDKVQYC